MGYSIVLCKGHFMYYTIPVMEARLPAGCMYCIFTVTGWHNRTVSPFILGYYIFAIACRTSTSWARYTYQTSFLPTFPLTAYSPWPLEISWKCTLKKVRNNSTCSYSYAHCSQYVGDKECHVMGTSKCWQTWQQLVEEPVRCQTVDIHFNCHHICFVSLTSSINNSHEVMTSPGCQTRQCYQPVLTQYAGHRHDICFVT